MCSEFCLGGGHGLTKTSEVHPMLYQIYDKVQLIRMSVGKLGYQFLFWGDQMFVRHILPWSLFKK